MGANNSSHYAPFRASLYSQLLRATTAPSRRDSRRGIAQYLGLGIPAIVLVGAMAVYASHRSKERDRAQAAARFHAVFDATPVGLAVIDDHSGEILRSTRRLQRLSACRGRRSKPPRTICAHSYILSLPSAMRTLLTPRECVALPMPSMRKSSMLTAAVSPLA